MKRYLIYVAVGPLLGGFWLLLTTTILSGYWSQPLTAALVGKLLKVFFTTLQYSYLFGFLPALMIGAIDDILSHIRRIAPLVRALWSAPSRLSPLNSSMAGADRIPERSSS